jgi:hypothetical protein
MTYFKRILIALISLPNLCGQCGEKDSEKALNDLFLLYQQGEISECRYNGEKVYSAGLNAPDAGTEIYDASAKKIGSCYYNTRKVDPICEKLENCEVIYRCDDHISGQPAIDKYQLKDDRK